MNNPEHSFDPLITADEKPRTQSTPKRPFLEKIGSWFILAGLAGSGMGIAICTTSATPFLTAEQFQGVEQFGGEVINYSGRIAAFGATIYLVSKLYHYLLKTGADIYADANKNLHLHS